MTLDLNHCDAKSRVGSIAVMKMKKEKEERGGKKWREAEGGGEEVIWYKKISHLFRNGSMEEEVLRASLRDGDLNRQPPFI